MKPVIVMQTDFSDTEISSAVCTMHGICQMIDPELRTFNNTHGIPPFDIYSAANALDYIVDYWPAGTIFVSVVDPGVGTARKACVAKLKNGQYVVTPDNGTLTCLYERVGIEQVREIDETRNRYEATRKCDIFHGRDLFAYCAARLASGLIDFEGVGPSYSVADIIRIQLIEPIEEAGVLSGMIQSASRHFGLVASNIPYQMGDKMGLAYGDMLEVWITCKGKEIYRDKVVYHKSFGYVREGQPIVMVSEFLTMQIALNLRNFVLEYNIGHGPEWMIYLKPV